MSSFVVFALPRSRTAWLSNFLTYGDHACGHEEIRHFRSLDDIGMWFSQPNTGSAETAAAPWWRLLDKYAPDTKIVVVRRPVDEVLNSLMRIPGVEFDADKLEKVIRKADRKLDQIEARMDNVLSVNFADLNDERVCAAVFEHCLPYAHDHDHWARLAPVNVQINMPALMRYGHAYAPAMEKLASIAKHRILSSMAQREPVSPDGITFQTETFDTWLRDARHLIEDHLTLIDEEPDNWKNKNLDLMRGIYEVGAMQIMTARCNGRMFGYLMTLISPSLTSEKVINGTHTTFFASPEFPGLGMKLQRAAIKPLKERGVTDILFEAGKRASGPRLSMLYKRLGAQDHGQVFRLQLTEN